ncbi:MAG: PspC domain-containing protein [Cyanobacteria bacterium SZAS LIN-3]|nr:PspC domain-containing protein [Cyanobacteria bacterium SZAS LIN-3]MBS2007366.1 PspC domain-containing protein [Cyanobacteria bacterium SZAS TMP-1]
MPTITGPFDILVSAFLDVLIGVALYMAHRKDVRLVPARSIIGGVCTGLSRRFGISVSVVRVIFLLAAAASGGAHVIFLYFLLWVTLPRS